MRLYMDFPWGSWLSGLSGFRVCGQSVPFCTPWSATTQKNIAADEHCSTPPGSSVHYMPHSAPISPASKLVTPGVSPALYCCVVYVFGSDS